MFNAFGFNLGFAIGNVKEEENIKLNKLIILGDAENYILDRWYDQFLDFTTYLDGTYSDNIPNRTKKTHEDFIPGDKPNKHEILVIKDYELPPYLKSKDGVIVSIIDNPSIVNFPMQSDPINSVIGFVNDEKNGDLLLFQKFQPNSQLMQSKMALVFDPNSLSFSKVVDSGLILGDRLSAVYNNSTQTLMFKSFSSASSVLNLDEYFKPLSESEIRDFLNHVLFEPEDIDEIAENPSYLLSTRFALVDKSGVLNNTTAQEIKIASEKYNALGKYKINVKLSSDSSKVIFPSKKSEAHKLLRLLNDDYFIGDFSKTAFIAGNKRDG